MAVPLPHLPRSSLLSHGRRLWWRQSEGGGRGEEGEGWGEEGEGKETAPHTSDVWFADWKKEPVIWSIPISREDGSEARGR